MTSPKRGAADDPLRRGTASEPATVGGLVSYVRGRLRAAGTSEPDIEARLLVQQALGLNTAQLLSASRDAVPPGALKRLAGPLSRRLKREPLPYILGTREFYGRALFVDRRVLIPRPETELLVERALEFSEQLAQRHSAGRPATLRRGQGLRTADVGTGSGALAITLALELPGARVFATDISEDALDVARRNAEALGASGRVTFLRGDLLEPLEGQFDIVVSNPPYVASATLGSGEPELACEPRLALDGGPDGLAVIRRLIFALPGILKPDASVALIEVDPLTAPGAASLARQAMPSANVEVLPDLAGLARCVEIRTGKAST